MFTVNAATDQLLGPAFTNPTGAYTMALWWRPVGAASGSASSRVFSVGDNAAGSVEVAFSWDHSNASFQQAWYHRTSAGAFPVAKYSTTLAAGTLYHCAGTYNGSNIRAYLNGSLETTSAAAAAPASTANSKLAFGDTFISGAITAPSGDGGEMAMWNVALTAAEVAALAQGFSPLLIRPQSLIEYWPAVRDPISRKNVAPVATSLDVTAHPRVFMPTRQRFLPMAAAAAGGATVNVSDAKAIRFIPQGPVVQAGKSVFVNAPNAIRFVPQGPTITANQNAGVTLNVSAPADIRFSGIGPRISAGASIFASNAPRILFAPQDVGITASLAGVVAQNRRYGVSMRGRLGTSRVSEVNVRTGEKTVSEY